MERPDPLHVADIAGATTKTLPVRTRGDHPFNSSGDIDGAVPRLRGLNTNRRTSPLDPSYVLPSFTADHRTEKELPAARDQLWTLPQTRWKPAPRDNMDLSGIEQQTSAAIRRGKLAERDTMRVADINASQFRCEQPTTRHTDPLKPAYIYDNGPVEHIDLRVPKYGSRYPRKESEQFSLMSKDVTASEAGTSLSVFSSEYPKELIKTRPTNRTDDIPGAQADTRCFGPLLWLQPGKAPANVPQKSTNRVHDMEGSAPGAGGRGGCAVRLYRKQKQVEAMKRSGVIPATKAAAAERAADIAAVKALD